MVKAELESNFFHLDHEFFSCSFVYWTELVKGLSTERLVLVEWPSLDVPSSLMPESGEVISLELTPTS